MELVEVKILGQVITAQYGTLSTGDILRTDAAFARHLVDDCSAAQYTSMIDKSVAPAAENPVLVRAAEIVDGSNADVCTSSGISAVRTAKKSAK